MKWKQTWTSSFCVILLQLVFKGGTNIRYNYHWNILSKSDLWNNIQGYLKGYIYFGMYWNSTQEIWCIEGYTSRLFHLSSNTRSILVTVYIRRKVRHYSAFVRKKFISAMLGINGAKPCPMVLYHIVWIFTCYILWYQISWEYDAHRGDVTYKMVHRCKVISNLNQNDLMA